MNDDDRDDPVAWLLLLERGRRTGDFELAASAQRELARLGIRVSYGRPRPGMNDDDRDEPVVWLLLLERGRRTGDFELIARAKRELAQLGIRVSYSRPLPGRRARHARSASR
jgi:hypothetical protein